MDQGLDILRGHHLASHTDTPIYCEKAQKNKEMFFQDLTTIIWFSKEVTHDISA